MVEKSKQLSQPSWNANVWRYFSLDKFLYLLKNRELVFTQADLLTDKNEVIFPYVALYNRRKRECLGKRKLWFLDSDLVDIESRCNRLKAKVYVSSWTAQREESFGLWKVYLGGNHSGVAVRTSYRNLTNSLLEGGHQISSGKVLYTKDFSGVVGDDLGELHDHHIVCSKHVAYSYENELRLFIIKETQTEMDEPGLLNVFGPSRVLSVDVDLAAMIESVHFSPWSPSWFSETLKDVVRMYAPELVARIKPSEIAEK